MKKILLSLFILFMPVCLWSGGVLFDAGGVEEVSPSCGDTISVGNLSDLASSFSPNIWIGCIFTSTSAGEICKQRFNIEAVGAATTLNVAVAIYATSASEPTGTALASGTAVIDFSGGAGIYELEYDSTYSDADATEYFLAMVLDGTNDSDVKIEYIESGGSQKFYFYSNSDMTIPSASDFTWADSVRDMAIAATY